MSGIFRTARQHGKSVMQTQAISAIFDEWDVIDNSKAEKPVEYLEFDDDPLALVCAMLRKGKQYHDIAEALHGNYQTRVTRDIPISQAIEAEDRERAIVVRKHFRNKILMRRLKNMNISKFMLAVSDLIESPQRIDKKSVSPLLKLSDFYEEDKATESIFNSHKTLPAHNKQEIDTTIEYVGTVKRRTSRTKVDMQYWRTPNNYLVRVTFPLNDMGRSAWEYFAKHGKVHISTEVGNVIKVTGYDYFVYQLNTHYEVKPV